MRFTLIMAIIFFLFTTISCEKPEADKPQDDKKYIIRDPKIGDGFKMITEKSLYDKVKLAAGDEKGAAFEIEKISREGNTLIVKVIYSSSCTDPSFDVVWDGLVMLSFPSKVNLALKMNADCADSQQQVSKEIKINLEEYVGTFAADKNIEFSVINGWSKKVTGYTTVKGN